MMMRHKHLHFILLFLLLQCISKIYKTTSYAVSAEVATNEDHSPRNDNVKSDSNSDKNEKYDDSVSSSSIDENNVDPTLNVPTLVIKQDEDRNEVKLDSSDSKDETLDTSLHISFAEENSYMDEEVEMLKKMGVSIEFDGVDVIVSYDKEEEEEEEEEEEGNNNNDAVASSSSSLLSGTKGKSIGNKIEVIELTSRTFSKAISDGSIWLIEFYSPRCIHCIQFAPYYDEIAAQFHTQNNQQQQQQKQEKLLDHQGDSDKKSNDDNDITTTKTTTTTTAKKYRRAVKVAKVDAGEEVALSSRFGIRALPSFFVIDGWNAYEYEEATRSKDGLIRFVDGGYLQTDPVPFYLSPMGPVGQMQGFVITTVHTLQDIFEYCQGTLGLSPVVTGTILFGSLFMGCFVMIVILAIAIPPTQHAKYD